MSTIVQLAADEALIKLDPGLGWREQEQRLIHAFPKVIGWLDEVLPGAASQWNIELSPAEQLDELLGCFCRGENLLYERQVRPLRHLGEGVWEIKTADLRLFGWFHARDCFICTAIDLAMRVKEINLYRGYAQEAVRMREALDLDEPKYIEGDDPHDVLSSVDFPA